MKINYSKQYFIWFDVYSSTLNTYIWVNLNNTAEHDTPDNRHR